MPRLGNDPEDTWAQVSALLPIHEEPWAIPCPSLSLRVLVSWLGGAGREGELALAREGKSI